jgi:hypothetical protein
MNSSSSFFKRSTSSSGMQSLGASTNALLSLQLHLDTTERQVNTPTRTVLEMLCSSEEIQKSNPMLVLSRRTHHIPSLSCYGKESTDSLMDLFPKDRQSLPSESVSQGAKSRSMSMVLNRTTSLVGCHSGEDKRKIIGQSSGDDDEEYVGGERTHRTSTKMQSRKTATCKPFIRRTTTRSSLIRRAEIPKWITFKTIETNSPSRPDQCENESEKLMPLADLAMVLSRNLDGAIARGLFESDPKRLSKKRTDMETLSTSSLTTIQSNFNARSRRRQSTQCFKVLF